MQQSGERFEMQCVDTTYILQLAFIYVVFFTCHIF